MNIQEIIQQPEGRRLEFKREMPTASDLAKTIVAFANDAGGDLYIGVNDNPRELIGIEEEELFKIEEQIASIIYQNCSPVIVPEIIIQSENNIHFIRVQIHRGSDFPYHLTSKGVKQGTYIRIGSTNRLADDTIIADLERRRTNVSFDSLPVYGKSIEDLDINTFRNQFAALVGEELNDNSLIKLGLLKEVQGRILPTNALILFSDNTCRKDFFPYSKIECARFKGTTSDTKIDDKTIQDQIGLQAAEAYKFIQRNVDQGSVIEDVYTKERWEYPMAAIRETLRNAVAHRDYSLTGKDIKVAIYDDMVEITSPGLLPASIDFNAMEARQSDIRNKVLAPVFKKMGIIDQWGNGLKIISDELKNYPEIEFNWFELGLQFQVQFIKKNYFSEEKLNKEMDQLGFAVSKIFGLTWHQVGTKLAPSWHQVQSFFEKANETTGIQNLMAVLGLKDRSKFKTKYINTLIDLELLQMTVPDKPNSSKQKYFLTSKGRLFLNLIQEKNKN